MCCPLLRGGTAVNMGAADTSETWVLLARTYVHAEKLSDVYCPFAPFLLLLSKCQYNFVM